jgi:hypothetical protein
MIELKILEINHEELDQAHDPKESLHLAAHDVNNL